MRIKALTGMVLHLGEDLVHALSRGSEIEVSDEIGAPLVAAGHAEDVTPADTEGDNDSQPADGETDSTPAGSDGGQTPAEPAKDQTPKTRGKTGPTETKAS